MSVRLSEAILAGSVYIRVPDKHEAYSNYGTEACAIGMALKAVGIQPLGSIVESFPNPLTILYQQNDYTELTRLFPWLEGLEKNCPKCGEEISDEELIWHPFDMHVVPQTMTLDAMVDWVRSFEPSEPVSTQPEGRDPECSQTVEMVCRK